MSEARHTLVRQVGVLADLLLKICFWIACGALVVIVCITLFEITMRYFFDSPTKWVSDSVRYLLAFLIMLGLPQVTREQGHVSITLFSDLLPQEHIYPRALFLISAVTCFFVTYLAVDVALTQFARNLHTQGTWRIPRVWITGAVSIGFGLAGLAFLTSALLPHKKA